MSKISIENVINDLGITEAQAQKLDSLDGKDQDGVTTDIYTMAKLVLAKKDNNQEYVKIYSDHIGEADLSVFLQVQDIMTETSNTKVKEYPSPQYFDKNSGDGSKINYIRYEV